jgi:hypothetical protein
MGIPYGTKFVTIIVDDIKKEIMQKPEVSFVIFVQSMKMLQSMKECSPWPSKLRAYFTPDTLNPTIACRSNNFNQ